MSHPPQNTLGPDPISEGYLQGHGTSDTARGLADLPPHQLSTSRLPAGSLCFPRRPGRDSAGSGCELRYQTLAHRRPARAARPGQPPAVCSAVLTPPLCLRLPATGAREHSRGRGYCSTTGSSAGGSPRPAPPRPAAPSPAGIATARSGSHTRASSPAPSPGRGHRGPPARPAASSAPGLGSAVLVPPGCGDAPGAGQGPSPARAPRRPAQRPSGRTAARGRATGAPGWREERRRRQKPPAQAERGGRSRAAAGPGLTSTRSGLRLGTAS